MVFMTNFPPVTIGVITYNRIEELSQTLYALDEHLRYDGELLVIVSDDCSPNDYASDVRMVLSGVFKRRKKRYITTRANGGWGRNANHLLVQAATDYLFMLEDDYVLKRELDLTRAVALMETRQGIGMVRYRGTAGMHVIYHQFESDIRPWLPHHHEGTGVGGKLTYLQLDSGSPDLWLYSNGPHLKRRSFHSFYGMYPEGYKLGQTEETFAHQVKDRMRQPGAPAIVIQPEWVHLWWDHIGRSYQGGEYDKGE